MTAKKWQLLTTSIRREMQLKLLRLQHSRPSRFCHSQWRCAKSTGCTAVYMTYRIIFAVYLLTGMLLNIIDVHALENRDFEWPEGLTYRAKWLVYLTNWTLAVLTAQAVIAAVLAVEHQLFRSPKGKMTKLHKWYWCLNNVGNAAALSITILYWTKIYNKDIHRLDFGNIHGHIMNSVLVVVDLMVTAHPVRLLHFYQPLIFGAAYLVFTFIYFVLGGTNKRGSSSIYPILDWQKPLIAIAYIVAGCVLFISTHVFVWILYQLRRFVAHQLGTNCQKDSEQWTRK
ncbi:protein rolling stone-like [Cloeon dipterum]|uniref:protein rolling stone-like n=1 Tax=Cloeon dipterum TaxID=197152 RepID=UPI00321FDAE0